MKAYSMDLRLRIVQAYDRGEGSQAELAEQFRVSERSLQRLLRQRRQTGSIAPQPHGGGRAAKVHGPTLLRWKQAVAEFPDASLDELRDRCGVDGSRMCIFRALRRLRLTRKKSRSAAPSSRTPPSSGNGRRGGARSAG
jgi:transposase